MQTSSAPHVLRRWYISALFHNGVVLFLVLFLQHKKKAGGKKGEGEGWPGVKLQICVSYFPDPESLDVKLLKVRTISVLHINQRYKCQNCFSQCHMVEVKKVGKEAEWWRAWAYDYINTKIAWPDWIRGQIQIGRKLWTLPLWMQEVQHSDTVSIYFHFQSFANGLSVSGLLSRILTKGSLDCSRVMAYLAQFIISVSTDFSVHTLSPAATSITQLMQSLVTELMQV